MEWTGTPIYPKAAVKLRHENIWVLGTVNDADCGNYRLVILLEIIEEFAGGMQDGLTLKHGYRVGHHRLLTLLLDLPMDFDSIQGAGSRMGTAHYGGGQHARHGRLAEKLADLFSA